MHTGVLPSRSSSWADFLALDEDDRRELIDGALLEVDVPTWLHEYIVMSVGAHLFNWAREHGGQVLASGYKVRISENRGVMPDVQYFNRERGRSLPEHGLSEGHPDLVVEVVSETSRRYDRVTKLAWYASIGVPEYWIVDPELRTFERLVLQNGRFAIADALCDDATFRPESFAGLTIELAELWSKPEPDGTQTNPPSV